MMLVRSSNREDSRVPSRVRDEIYRSGWIDIDSLSRDDEKECDWKALRAIQADAYSVDSYLCASTSLGGEAVLMLLREIASTRKPKARSRALGAVLMSFYSHRAGWRVGVMRRQDTYRNAGFSWWALREVLAGLERHQYVVRRITGTKASRKCSVYQSTTKLVDWLRTHVDDNTPLVHGPPPAHNLITAKRKLNSTTHKTLRVNSKRRTIYEKRLSAINTALAKYTLHIPKHLRGPQNGISKSWCEYQSARVSEIDKAPGGIVQVRMVSGDSQLTSQNRLYHWASNLPGSTRRQCQWMIDDVYHDVIEIDLKSSHPHLMYAREGLKPPAGDLYAIEGVPRKVVKMTFQFLTNTHVVFERDVRKDRKSLSAERVLKKWLIEQYELAELYEFDECKERPTLTLDECESLQSTRHILEAVLAAHPALVEPYFSKHKSWGPSLMADEAEICTRVVESCLAEGIPVSPHHDSWLIPAYAEERVLDIVRRHWCEVTGVTWSPAMTVESHYEGERVAACRRGHWKGEGSGMRRGRVDVLEFSTCVDGDPVYELLDEIGIGPIFSEPQIRLMGAIIMQVYGPGGTKPSGVLLAPDAYSVAEVDAQTVRYMITSLVHAGLLEVCAEGPCAVVVKATPKFRQWVQALPGDTRLEHYHPPLDETIEVADLSRVTSLEVRSTWGSDRVVLAE